MAAGAIGVSHLGEVPTLAQSSDHPELEAESELQELDEVEIVRKAKDVLGMDQVARWMRSKIPSLGNQTPYSLMSTAGGRRQVQLVLQKIEHGVY